MNEDEMRRIREQQEQLEAWARERRQEIRQEVLSQAERDQALSDARRTTLLGAIPSVLLYVLRAVEQGWTEMIQVMGAFLCFGIPFVMVVTAAAAASGLFAHWWFHGTGFSVRRMAIVLALLSDTVIFGWVLVLTR